MGLPLRDFGDLNRRRPFHSAEQFDYGALLRAILRFRLPGLGDGLGLL
jgi:hypothetical protein